MDGIAFCAGLFQSKIVEAVDPSRFRVAYRGAKAWEFINSWCIMCWRNSNDMAAIRACSFPEMILRYRRYLVVRSD